jgi:hypothetical protein
MKTIAAAPTRRTELARWNQRAVRPSAYTRPVYRMGNQH